MHGHRGFRQLLKGLGKHNRKLEAEQSLGAGQDDAGLRQQLFDLDPQRCVNSLVRLAARDHAFALPDKSLWQLWEAIPEGKRQTGSYHARRDRDGALAEDRLRADEESDTQREREWQQRQIRDNRREAMQSAAVLACLDNAVIGTGGDQQTDGTDEERQPDPIRVAGIFREFVKPLAKHPAKPEAEQNLGPEDQDPGFVKRDFDLF
ncbi:MAG TPA: hypothetical protein VGF39_18920 [Stellaceae bacterium]